VACKAILRGSLLREKAKQIATQLGYTNGWLESWKKRHNIKQVVVREESGDVRGETASSWKEQLSEVFVQLMYKT